MIRPAEDLLLGFARAVRAAGVPVTADRARSFVEAVTLVGLADRQACYWAGRATLCGGPDDLDRYDQVFEAWFLAGEGLPRTVPRAAEAVRPPALPSGEGDGGGPGEEADADLVRVAASDTEILRHRDVAGLSARDKAQLTAMIAALQPRLPRRRAHRRTPWHRGDLDGQRTLRRTLRLLGEPGPVAWRRRGTRPRRVVLLVDVSGSMSRYADVLLRVAHRLVQAAPAAVEVFTIGTRLTRVTRALRHRDPERALIAAGDTVPDWSGGTRLGETIGAFLARWGRRGMARGAVVVVFSDGWERGDCAPLAEQVEGLARLAHRVVWVNPHRGKAGYQPVQQGIRAVLPYLDEFVAGHSLATYAELMEVIAGA